jgi:hypothetical protein
MSGGPRYNEQVSSQFLARLILSAVAGVQGVAPLFIDLNRTHAANPRWTGHARFHLVWQALTAALLAIPELALVWWTGPEARAHFYLAAGFIAVSMTAFVLALLLRRLYGGALHDTNGIPPLRLRIGDKMLQIDGNALAVGAALVVLATAVLLFFRAG